MGRKDTVKVTMSFDMARDDAEKVRERVESYPPKHFDGQCCLSLLAKGLHLIFWGKLRDGLVYVGVARDSKDSLPVHGMVVEFEE